MEEDGFVLVKQQKRKGKPSKKPQPPRFDACQVKNVLWHFPFRAQKCRRYPPF